MFLGLLVILMLSLVLLTGISSLKETLTVIHLIG